MFACLYRPPAPDASPADLIRIAREFSPGYEPHRDELVSIDISGLERLLGSPRTIGEELRREAAARGIRVHVAVARTRMAAVVLARARPGLTVVDAGAEAAALAPVPVRVLQHIQSSFFALARGAPPPRANDRPLERRLSRPAAEMLETIEHWGIRTLGELAALPSADLAARLGEPGLRLQAIARGQDARPLVPDRPDDPFESAIDLEWPIEGLEPLSFVLTRLLEPLSIRLERKDRGVAALSVTLRLVTRNIHTRRLELPSPMRDVKTLRTLALLDLESHPPDAAIDRVTVTIDPTPGRILQHTLFTRPHPMPEQLSTLIARLNALMGQDRVGAMATVDSYRPGAFDMRAFTHSDPAPSPVMEAPLPPKPVAPVLRRCRQPVPARVAIGVDRRPARLTTDRRGFAGGPVTSCAGPWCTSGEWWEIENARGDRREMQPAGNAPWDRDEWDVALGDGAVYRIFHDRATDAWFIDAIVD